MGEGAVFISPRLTVGRRGVIAGIAAGATAASAALLPRPALAGIPASNQIAFEVFRNAKPIGAHSVTFTPARAALEVRIQIDLVVRWAGLVLYRYAVRGNETWRDGVLIAAQGETNDDGTRHAMRATRRDGRLLVEGTHGPSYVAPEKSIVSTHWNPAQLGAPMISVQDGQLLDFRIDPRGRATINSRDAKVETDHFALSGPATLELWYDRRGIWSKLQAVSWEGSTIEYRPA